MESNDSSLYEFDFAQSEFDVSEYKIPPSGSPPSLDSVLRDLADDEDDKQSITSSSTQKDATQSSILHHLVLQGITSQLSSAVERISSGLPTTLTATSIGLITVGTAHGLIFTFDSSQSLRWCNRESEYGAVSCLSFNYDATRLLAGYERGHINMINVVSGDTIRSMPDAHAPCTAVLHVRFSDWPNLAFCADSGGCVFSLNFERRLAIRTWNSKCLFSGARGEVCTLEPLLSSVENELRQFALLAMATLSKIIVVSVRPKLRIVFTHPLSGHPNSLPQIAWQSNTHSLIFARSSNLFLYRLGQTQTGLRFQLIRQIVVPNTILSVHFLGYRCITFLDSNEILHLLDSKSLTSREIADLSNVRLVYASAHFKALATGGLVSLALAKAGEKACYGSLASVGRRLLVLGIRGLHSVTVRTSSERLRFLRDQGRWEEVLKLVTASGNRDKGVEIIREYIRSENVDRDNLEAALECCIGLNIEPLIYSEIWPFVSTSNSTKSIFFNLLSNHIVNGRITQLTPDVSQSFVAFHENRNTLHELESILPYLEISCLDLHQLLTACRNHKLYSTQLWLNSVALKDYIQPLVDLLPELQGGDENLGNVLLVYVSCCLSGKSYPFGDLNDHDSKSARSEVLIHLLASPYNLLKALLKHDPYACVTMFELAFVEPDFTGELGLYRRKQVLKLLLEISDDSTKSPVIGLLVRSLNSGWLDQETEYIDEIEKWLEDIQSDTHFKEQIWLDLLSTDLISKIDKDRQLEIAENSKCYHVKEVLLEQMERYDEILDCYLSDNIRKHNVFEYMKKHSKTRERNIREQILSHFETLLEIDEQKTLDLIMTEYPDLISILCERLTNNSNHVSSLLNAALNCNVPITSQMANLAKDIDSELAARLLEATGELNEALSLLLMRGKELKAADLCSRVQKPEELLNSVSEPKLLSRLLKATLKDCVYKKLLYETTFRILSYDLNYSLRKELAKSHCGKFVPRGTTGCLIHPNSCDSKPVRFEKPQIEADKPLRPDMEGLF